MKTSLSRFGTVVIIVILTLAGIETVIRFLLWAPYNPWERYRVDKVEGESPLGIVDTDFSSIGLGDLVPNQDGIWTFKPDMPYHVQTNSLGFRNSEELIEDKDIIRILAIGDSFTFGPFVNNEDTWTAWLETLLNRQYYPDVKFQVLNAGFPGYTITDELAYLEDKGLKVDPDLVILNVTPNDVRDFAPEKRARFARPTNQRIISDADNDRTLDTIRDVLETHSATFQLIRNIRFQLTITQAEQILEGNELANEDLENTNQITDKTLERQQLYNEYLPTYETYFTEFVSLLNKNDIPLLVVYFPTVDQLPLNSSLVQQKNLTQMTVDNEVPFLDLLPFYRSDDNDLTLYLYTFDTELGYVGDGHPSRYGHYVSADAISNFLIEGNLLPIEPG